MSQLVKDPTEVTCTHLYTRPHITLSLCGKSYTIEESIKWLYPVYLYWIVSEKYRQTSHQFICPKCAAMSALIQIANTEL
jgi:hypothetical protein